MDVFDLIVGALALIGLLTVGGMVWEGIDGLRARRGNDWIPVWDADGDEDAVALAQANAERLDEQGEWFMATPAALEREPLFVSAVEALSDEETPVEGVLELARHPDGWAASMALAALERRDDLPGDWVDAAIRGLPRSSNCEDAFALRAIARHASTPVIGRILGRHEGIAPEFVVAFVRSRVEGGEVVSPETFRGDVTASQADELQSYLDRFGAEMGAKVTAAFDEWRTLELFGSIGRLWQRPFDRPPAHLVGRRGEVVELLEAALAAGPRRSVLLVGEHGAGKTTLGDQFLFVSAPGGTEIEVTFVDPDAEDRTIADEPSGALELPALARSGRGDERSARFVLSEASRVAAAVEGLAPQKAGALAALGEPTFWEADGRFDVLAKAEYLDRLEASTKTAVGLAARLERSLLSGGRAGVELVELLAGRLYVLDCALEGLAAEDPYELFLEVRSQEAGAAFRRSDRRDVRVVGGRARHGRRAPSRRERWEPVRRLRSRMLADPASGGGPPRPGDRRRRGRAGGGARDGAGCSRSAGDWTSAGQRRAHDAARASLEAVAAANTVVRRYRTGPSPLVRDSRRGYRTGNLEQVLAGEFDLY